MKFACDRCQTRYSIADEKVRQRILRIRCKNCGAVITVQSGEIVPGHEDASKRPESAGRGGSPSGSRPSFTLTTPARPNEWFVAIDGVEQGPLSCADAAKCIVSLKPEQSVHVWKEGMDGWKQPKDVAIIAQEISTLRLAPAGSSSHSPARPAPAGSSTARRPAPPPTDSTARVQVPATRPKPPPAGAGSGPRLAPPGISGSGPKLSPAISGSGLKSASPPVSGSGLNRGSSSLPGSGLKGMPPSVSGSGVKRPPPLPGSGPKAVPAPVPGPGSKPATSGLAPAVSRPLPRLSSNLPALPGLTPSGPSPRSTSSMPASQIEAGKAATTSPEKRRSTVQEVVTASTPAPVSPSPKLPIQPHADDEFENAQKTIIDDEFDKAPRTPLPDAPLPALAPPTGDAQAVAKWPPPPLAVLPEFLPPASPEVPGTPAATNLSIAPAVGSGNVAMLPAPLFPAVHAEAGLSKLTGLAGLAQRHRHLKYVVAVGVVVILIILVILVSWRGETAKSALPPLAPAASATAAPPSVEAEAPPRVEDVVAPKAASKGRPAARGASKRPSPHSVKSSGKGATVGEDPFEAPPASAHVTERRVPVQMPSQSRGSPTAGKEVSQAQIGAVVRSKDNQAGLKTCYERALRRDGRLRTARLDITVSIGEGGTVQRVQVHGPTDFLIIDSCLKNAIRHWRFPANAEEYATSFPLILQGG